jgi:hypothetical protein
LSFSASVTRTGIELTVVDITENCDVNGMVPMSRDVTERRRL